MVRQAVPDGRLRSYVRGPGYGEAVHIFSQLACAQGPLSGRFCTLRLVQALVIAVGDWCWEES